MLSPVKYIYRIVRMTKQLQTVISGLQDGKMKVAKSVKDVYLVQKVPTKKPPAKKTAPKKTKNPKSRTPTITKSAGRPLESSRIKRTREF